MTAATSALSEKDHTMHPTLQRLEELGEHLAERGDVIALLGLGSAGEERDRFDDHSDLDFFVIVDDGAKPGYLADIDWLEAPYHVAYSFVNDLNGRKALYADGVFVEYAIFTLNELAQVPFTGARIVWQRPGAHADLGSSGAALAGPPIDTVDFHLNEALTNPYVGLHRELRGEHLTAARFIQTYAVDQVLALLRLSSPARPHHRDAFDPSRRVETAYPPDLLPVSRMVPGYDNNPSAARATLAWLTERFQIDHVIRSAIEELLEETSES